jgi:hypothetical protein
LTIPREPSRSRSNSQIKQEVSAEQTGIEVGGEPRKNSSGTPARIVKREGNSNDLDIIRGKHLKKRKKMHKMAVDLTEDDFDDGEHLTID